MTALPGLSAGDAMFSPCGRYRYELTRSWAAGPWALWIMLNPSTADADVDDPTIRRCIGFSKREGCGGLAVVNLYPYRATDPSELLSADDPDGPPGVNKATIRRWLVDPFVGVAVAGWGAWWEANRLRTPRGLPRLNVEQLARDAKRELRCLGRTRDGSPRHPLYVRGDAPLEVLS